MLDEGCCPTNREAALRILALGDCNTNSLDQRQGLVPVELAAKLRTSSRQVELTNIGFGMATCREARMQIRVYSGPADILVLNYGLVDAWQTTFPAIYLPLFPETRLKKYARKLLKLTKRRLRGPVVRKFVPTGSVVPPAEYRDNLADIIQVFLERNAQAVVVLWSTPFVANDDERNSHLARYNEIISEMAANDHVVFVESNEILTRIPMQSRFIDSVHLSIPAARILSDAIITELDQYDRSLIRGPGAAA